MLIDRIKLHEGFESKPYKDHLGKLTIGYGTLLEHGITKEEANALLEIRLKNISDRFVKVYEFTRLDKVRQDVILEMSYQLGFNGVMKFKNMWKALIIEDYDLAAAEMLDSKWHKQTPSRAEELSMIMANG